MYRYEELDYNQITNDSEIDPNSAEACYALAQCCRLGKGIAPDMEMYREYLEYAAEEGHEEAAKELEALGGGHVNQVAASAVEVQPFVFSEADAASKERSVSSKVVKGDEEYASLSVSELRRMADGGNAAAAFRLYEVSRNIGDNKNAVVFLKRAGEYAAQNGVEKKTGQKIFWMLGEMIVRSLINVKKAIDEYRHPHPVSATEAELKEAEEEVTA